MSAPDPRGHRVTWFPPERSVEGNTVFRRPAPGTTTPLNPREAADGPLQTQESTSTIERGMPRAGSESHGGGPGASGAGTAEVETPGAQTGPAERLRSAADLIEQRAAGATSGPWRTNDVEGIFYVASARSGPVTMDNDNPVCVCDYDREGVAIERDEDKGGRADGEWMALMSPDLAAPLAAWLRAEAEQEDRIAHLHDGTEQTPALAVADVILDGAA